MQEHQINNIRDTYFVGNNNHRTPWIWRQWLRQNGNTFYYVACICIVIIAALSRFYGLTEHAANHDEAIVANHAKGNIGQVLHLTRCCDTSPILNPLILYLVQKVEISKLTIRLPSAIFSTLTVAAILFLIPSLSSRGFFGISRASAVIASLMMLLSVRAIEQAQHAGVYSIDALVAMLMIAGILHYTRSGNLWLLCASLFIAPLTQYGLVLFGIAVVGTLTLRTVGVLFHKLSIFRPDASEHAVRWKDLIWPCAFFFAGCAISYALVLRYQINALDRVMGYISDISGGYYGEGLLDAGAIFEFAYSQTRAFLTYHMQEILSASTVVVLCLLLMVSARIGRLNSVVVLFLLSASIALFAALIGLYPFGDLKQTLYLSPVLFLVSGHAVHAVASWLSCNLGKPLLSWGVVALCIGGLLFFGITRFLESTPYPRLKGVEPVLETMQQQVQQDDLVHISARMIHFVSFYLKEKPENYYYGENCVDDPPEECFQSIVDLPLSTESGADRIWLLVTKGRSSILKELEDWSQQGLADRVATNQSFNLYLLDDRSLVVSERMRIARSRTEEYHAVAHAEPVISSNFDVYINDRTLIYVKDGCSSNDVSAPFFLHISPDHVDHLPMERRDFGFDSLNFSFSRYGIRFENRCIAVVPLPDYPAMDLTTGQFTETGELWSGIYNFAVPGISDALLEWQRDGQEPLIRSSFDVYMYNNRLIYSKPSCTDQDSNANFFLHVYPVFSKDLPEHRGHIRFDNLDFVLQDRGGRHNDRSCLASVNLPQYPIAAINTGQFTPKGQLWTGRIDLSKNIKHAYSAQYDSIETATPLVESNFNIHLIDGVLIYSKQPCTADETKPPFFLHITPADKSDLPDHRQDHYFDNLDFRFETHGNIDEDKCVAIIELPDYDITSIRTGQWIREESKRLWTAEIPFNP